MVSFDDEASAVPLKIDVFKCCPQIPVSASAAVLK
jgi:hypothetical protein